MAETLAGLINNFAGVLMDYIIGMAGALWRVGAMVLVLFLVVALVWHVIRQLRG